MASAGRVVARTALRLWLPAAVVIGWWFWSAHSRSLYFPPLQTILSTFRHDWLFRLVAKDVIPSVRDFLAGFGLAVIGGISLGTAVALVRGLRRALEPLLHFLRSLPPPALLPFGLVILGLGSSMKIGVIAAGALWPTLVNTIDGVAGVDPSLKDLSAAYRLGPWRTLRHVVLPAASPFIFAGIRTTLQISIILIVVSEMVASTGGIGYYVLESQQSFAVAQTWAGTLLLGLLGLLANAVFVVVEAWALRWHAGLRTGVEG
ncbi:MAG: ABC transporter permease [Acidimicrobiales bacterium]